MGKYSPLAVFMEPSRSGIPREFNVNTTHGAYFSNTQSCEYLEGSSFAVTFKSPAGVKYESPCCNTVVLISTPFFDIFNPTNPRTGSSGDPEYLSDTTGPANVMASTEYPLYAMDSPK